MATRDFHVELVAMQCKRRRNDFASTEVGEVSGGRVTQQAFEVVYKEGQRNQQCSDEREKGLVASRVTESSQTRHGRENVK